nr:hypothetical protein [Tanacetum cinerariifolium]
MCYRIIKASRILFLIGYPYESPTKSIEAHAEKAWLVYRKPLREKKAVDGFKRKRRHGCLASSVIIVFDYIPLRCDIDALSMPSFLSLPLSMACDESDGCVTMAMMNRYEKVEIIHTLAWQHIAFAAMAERRLCDHSSFHSPPTQPYGSQYPPDEKMLCVHWRPSAVQSYNDDVITVTSTACIAKRRFCRISIHASGTYIIVACFVIATQCRGNF